MFFLVLCFLSSPSFAKEGAQGTIQAVSETSTANSASSTRITELLEKLAINKGKGQFIQQKHFSFMSVPITSTGQFIVKGQSALWQTQQPVFSALLLIPDAIYRRLSLDDQYQLLTDSAEFSGVLSTIFTGKVNADDWQLNSSVDDNCLELTPKSGQLQQLFQQVDLCLIKETQMNESTDKPQGNANKQRQITLTDSKGDKTVIVMTLSNDLFVPRDFDALKHTSSQPGNLSDR
jgi:hypothetical protein